MDRLEQIASLQALLDTQWRRLKVLEERRATYGISTPAEVIIDIENTQEDIRQTKQRLRHLGVREEDLPSENIPSKSSSTNIQQLNNLPGPSYEKFVSRPNEYKKIEQRLHSGHPIVIIWGYGGTGKTSLARKIAGDCLKGHIKKSDGTALFDAIVWLSEKFLSGPDYFDSALNTIAHTLHYQALSLEQSGKTLGVYESLRRQKVLLVIDGYETVNNEQLFDWLFDLPEESKVLITTRELRQDLIQERPIEIEGMAIGEALIFAEQILQDEHSARIDKAQLERLIVAAGGNPQAIKVSLCLVLHSHGDIAKHETLADVRMWSPIDLLPFLARWR